MATFDTPVPQMQPTNTAFWARPIEQPKPDLSGGTLAKGLGATFNEATTAADEFIKEGVIKPQEEKYLGDKRNQFADALNSARAWMDAPSSAADQPTQLLTGENMPTAVTQVGDKMQMMQDSMTGGHLSETKYYGDIDNYLRRMRTQYPGYKDYIDNEAYRITGVRPGNAYIRSQISDLNRMLAQHAEGKDKWETRVHENQKYYSGDEINHMNQLHAAGKMTTEMFDAETAERAHNEWLVDRKLKQYQLDQQGATQDGKNAASALNAEGGRIVGNYNRFGTLAAYGDKSPQTAIEDLSSKRVDIPTEQAYQIAAQLRLKRAALVQQLTAFANADRGDKPSLMNSLKGQSDTPWESIVKAQMAPIDEFIEALVGKNPEVALLSKHTYEGIEADERVKLDKKDSETGGWGAKFKFAKDNMGPVGEALFMQKYFPQLGKQFDGVLGVDLVNGMTQPNLKPDGTGKPNTFKEALEDIQKRKGSDKARDAVLGWIDLYTNKDTGVPIKQNLNRFFYDTDNWGNLRNVSNGEYVYSKLFNPTTAKETAKLGPDAWKLYQGAAVAEGSTVFGKNFTTLADYQTRGIKFSWDSDKGLGVEKVADPYAGDKDVIGSTVAKAFSGYYGKVLDAKLAERYRDQINTLYQSLRAVYAHSPYKNAGEDAESTLVELMLERGFNPKEAGVSNEILKNIIASRSKSGKPPLEGAE